MDTVIISRLIGIELKLDKFRNNSDTALSTKG
jgi:hypothetical protein